MPSNNDFFVDWHHGVTFFLECCAFRWHFFFQKCWASALLKWFSRPRSTLCKQSPSYLSWSLRWFSCQETVMVHQCLVDTDTQVKVVVVLVVELESHCCPLQSWTCSQLSHSTHLCSRHAVLHHVVAVAVLFPLAFGLPHFVGGWSSLLCFCSSCCCLVLSAMLL